MTAEKLDDRQAEFMKLKVEGISDCAELLVMSLMDKRDPHILAGVLCLKWIFLLFYVPFKTCG